MVNRTALGKLKDDTYGLEVSKPGVDVLTYTDPQNLAFSSKMVAASSIILAGSVTMPASGDVVITFPGTMPYVPMCYVMYTGGGTTAWNGRTSGALPMGGGYFLFFAGPPYYVTTTSLTLRGNSLFASKPIKYLVLRTNGYS